MGTPPSPKIYQEAYLDACHEGLPTPGSSTPITMYTPSASVWEGLGKGKRENDNELEGPRLSPMRPRTYQGSNYGPLKHRKGYMKDVYINKKCIIVIR
jgi:hypothetical protein